MTGRRLLRNLAVSVTVTVCAVPATPPAAADTAPPDGFAVLSDLDPAILTDIRYAGPHNFVGSPIAGYDQPLCILTRPAAEALVRARRAVAERGYTLKVYDCYRPQRAVDEFVAWAQDLGDQRMKPEFYPRVDKSTLFADGYIAERSGHSRGSTVDVTLVALPPAGSAPYTPGQPLVDCTAPQGIRFADDSIDMGTGYDCFDPLANTEDPRIGGEEAKNRRLLLDALTEQGFVNYDKEWWHFTFRPADSGEPYPDTYFDFPVRA